MIAALPFAKIAKTTPLGRLERRLLSRLRRR